MKIPQSLTQKKYMEAFMISWMMVHGAMIWLSSEQGFLMSETTVQRMAQNKTS